MDAHDEARCLEEKMQATRRGVSPYEHDVQYWQERADELAEDRYMEERE